MYVANLVQVIKPDEVSKNGPVFGYSGDDYVVDINNNFLYHLGYSKNSIETPVIVSKFNLPSKSDGIDVNGVKVLELTNNNALDYKTSEMTGMQDCCCHNGQIILNEFDKISFYDFESNTIVHQVPSVFNNGFTESEGIDICNTRNDTKLYLTYINKDGLYEFSF